LTLLLFLRLEDLALVDLVDFLVVEEEWEFVPAGCPCVVFVLVCVA
jgi:hypothetical protein